MSILPREDNGIPQGGGKGWNYCQCICHEKGSNAVHCMPCCDICPVCHNGIGGNMENHLRETHPEHGVKK